MAKKKGVTKGYEPGLLDAVETQCLDVYTLNLRLMCKYKSGLSISEVARRAGVQRTYLTKVLRGDHSVGLGTAARLAFACESTIAEMIDGPMEFANED